MKRSLSWIALGALAAAAATLAACGKKVEEKKTPEPPPSGSGSGAAPAAVGAAPGVDPVKKVITLGGLYDQSGPAKQIGVHFVTGKRLLAKAVAAGAVKLPDGWKIEILEKDHAYNPQQSVQLYKEIRDQVLLITTSFGTAATLPLVEDLRRDNMIAFPASLSSAMAANEHTPPLGPSYPVEAMRAMDWAVETAGGADKVKAGIVHQRDDYGLDGLAGWKQAAEFHKITLVAEQAVKPTDQDFTAVVKALKDGGATHVLLTVLPSAVPGILGAAAKLSYEPVWIGDSPTWVDAFFTKLPAALLARYHLITGLTFWGEDVPGMKDFLDVWKAHGAELGEPDFYIYLSYVQGLVQIEVLRRAIEAKQLDRAGVLRALHTVTSFDAGGLLQPVNLSKVPYVTSTRTRILAPDLEKKTWKVVAGWAEPKALAKP